MAKKINEAQVKIDIAGLESDDLEALSRMLALAGQAEKQSSVAPTVSPIAPLDFGSFGGSAEEPEVVAPEMGADVAPVPEIGEEDPLAQAVDDLSGSVTDFGADAEGEADIPVIDVEAPGEEDELSLDMSGQPKLESTLSDEDEEVIEEEFDFGRMMSLAGLPVTEAVDEDEEEIEEEVTESQILPDLSLEEESPVLDTTDFGPFRSEYDAVQDGQAKTNGVEGDNFIVVPKGNQFYWRRVVQEELDNVPNPEEYDNEGNVHRVHEFKPKAPGTALGDNPLNVYEAEEEESDEDESVEDIFESLQSKYNKFLGDK